jgi:16S rRNA (uracil1498-N3)-methyltransferase
VRITRLFVEQHLEVGQEISLPEKSAHHVLHVLRKNVSDELVLFNGRGGEYPSIISGIKRNHVSITIRAKHEANRESPISLTLGLGILKRDAMNTALQKATELGVSKIIPIEASNTSVSRKHSEKRTGQWQQVIESACEQSGRTQLPVLESVETFEDFLCVERDSLNLIASPTAETHLKEIEYEASSICITIGPEGGFSETELALAMRNNFLPITIGPRILRAETMPAVILSLLQYRWGDF